MAETHDTVHRDRARAESFGSIAERYDRFRPSYPNSLIDDLEATGARTVLDIACGTGIAARELAARGLSVLGVEVDPQMAAVARAHGLDVETASFEDWDGQDRTYDLITCAQAWHWIDQDRGAHKVANLLRPGGLLACFWNYNKPHDLADELNKVYRRCAPEVEPAAVGMEPDDQPYADVFRDTGMFGEVAVRRYEWSQTMTATEWVGRATTYSDHILLPKDQCAALMREAHAVLAAHEPVTIPMGTYAIFAKMRR
jgi:SAM-dependent methyltransferase